MVRRREGGRAALRVVAGAVGLAALAAVGVVSRSGDGGALLSLRAMLPKNPNPSGTFGFANLTQPEALPGSMGGAGSAVDDDDDDPDGGGKNGLTTPAAVAHVSLFKRTHVSTDASATLDFVQTMLGFSLDLNASYHCLPSSPGSFDRTRTRELCAKRTLFMTLGSFSMHYFESHVTQDAPRIGVREWVQSWESSLDFSDDDWAWNEFTSQSVSFYVARDLEDFIILWKKNDVPFLGRMYYEGSSRVPVYSVRITVPGVGHVVEIVSDNVTAAYAAEYFAAYDVVAECPGGHALNKTMDELRGQWEIFDAAKPPGPGMLPVLLVAQISQPVSDADKIRDFHNLLLDTLDTVDIADILVADYAEPILRKQDDDDAGLVPAQCSYSDTHISLNDDYLVPIRFIHNPGANQREHRTVKDFEDEYLSMDGIAGCDAAYGRYMDWHVGVMPSESYLDQIARRLCRKGVGFKAGGHATTDDDANLADTIGAVWSRGASGLGIEFDSLFDWTYFDPDTMRHLDYCSKNGTMNIDAVASLDADDEDQIWCPRDYNTDCDDCVPGGNMDDRDDDPAIAWQ